MTGRVVWVVAAAAVVVVVTLVAVVLQRRGLRRRLATAVVRLDPDATDLEGSGGTERLLIALERAVERSREELGAAEAGADRLARALGAIPQAVVISDERGQEVFRNGMAAAYAGARHAEALVDQAVRDLLAAALDGQVEHRRLDLYGPPRRMLELTGMPFDDGHRSTGALVVVDDVSDRRRLEAVRRDFVANISHELKTPIGALGLLAETILAEEEPDVVRRLARRMQDEAFRVGRIIDDLLDLSRIEAEEQPRREPVPVHLVVAEALDRVRTLADSRGIVLAGDDLPPRLTVRGDRRQLVSAVFNLLENAVKYSDDGSRVEVQAVGGDGWVEVAVADRGMGIPTRDLERVFERFYRVDRARSRQTGGTGLGLAIVRHVATNHGGEVRVTSREGEGSTFTLRLPAGPGGTDTAMAGTVPDVRSTP